MLRICGIIRESIVDGPGFRFVVFVQGCPHHCPGCHNPQSHDPKGGSLCEASRIIEEFQKDPILKGITLSGGEPMEQAAELIPVAKAVLDMGKDVVIFSGYTFEELLEKGKTEPEVLELLACASLLIDGRFIQAQRDLTLRFRGSRNQRLIDVPRSLKEGRAIVLSEDKV